MKKLKYIFTTFILFLILPLLVRADCQSDLKNEFKKVEDQYKVTYEYNINSDDFTITITYPADKGFSYGFNSKDEYNKAKINTTNNMTKITINNYKSTTYMYTFLGNKNCTPTEVLKQTITLTKPNKFAYSDKCKGNEEFVLCQEDYDKEIDEATFESRLKLYEESKESNSTNNNNEKGNKTKNKDNKKNNSFLDNIKKYIEENTFQVVAIIIFVIVLIITIVMSIISARKSRRLE